MVIIPAKGELAERAFSQGTEAFITAVQEAGLEPDDGLLGVLELDDYFTHDGHFAAGGSEVVAARVLEILQRHAT